MAYGAVAEVHIHGLRELQRDLAKVDRKAANAVLRGIREMAEPVAHRAESLAQSSITNIGDRWSEMRVGVRTATVYVAPRARRRQGSPRSNLGVLLMTNALIPAVESYAHALEVGVERELDHLLDHVGL